MSIAGIGMYAARGVSPLPSDCMRGDGTREISPLNSAADSKPRGRLVHPRNGRPVAGFPVTLMIPHLARRLPERTGAFESTASSRAAMVGPWEALAVRRLIETDIQPSVRRGVLNQLQASLDRVSASGRGEIVLLHGAPRIGRSAVLAQWVSEIGAIRGAPRIVAGGFRAGAARGELCAWLLPRKPPVLRTAGVRAAGLGDWISAAAAGGAMFDPTGVWKTATSIAAFIGQTGTASTSTIPNPIPDRVGADELAHAVDRLSRH